MVDGACAFVVTCGSGMVVLYATLVSWTGVLGAGVVLVGVMACACVVVCGSCVVVVCADVALVVVGADAVASSVLVVVGISMHTDVSTVELPLHKAR